MPDQPTSLSQRVPDTHRSHRLLAAGVLVACLLITSAGWAMVRREVELAGQQLFDPLTELARNRIREPVRAPQRVLEGLPGLIGSSDPIGRDRWGESLPTAVLGGGTLFSLFAATLTWSLGITRSRGRAILLADNLNDDLRRQILALAAELRYFAEGNFRFSLVEVPLGVPLPGFAMEMAGTAVSGQALTEMCMYGKVFSPKESDAVRLGTLVSAESLVNATVERAASLAKLPRSAFASTKTRLRAGAVGRARTAIVEEGPSFMAAFEAMLDKARNERK